jgi:aspartyl-tRNA(Asn)/glutamyl-tRNA(Gln) amidotransferase subunit B
MRGKEDEADYRYFPEPDLPPLEVDAAFIEKQRGYLPESGASRRARYVAELGLSEYDAGVLTASSDVSDFFESTARLSGDAKQSSHWVQNEVLRGLADSEVSAPGLIELPLRPADLAEVMEMVAEGILHRNAARTVLDEIMRHGGRPAEVVEAKGLRAERDEGRIESWCRATLQAKPQIADQVLGGNEKAIGALIGPVMQASGGSADPKLVREVLLRLIQADEA